MDFYEGFKHALGLGLEPKELTFIQVSLRGIIVFFASLVILRVSNKRFLSKMTAFDALLGFMMASMLARAINGSSAFFPTLGGGFVLVALHRIIAGVAFHSEAFGRLVKGAPDVLVEDGVKNQNNMRINHISEHDLLEEARLNGQVENISEIQKATLERSGHVSVIPVK
jgi:uncharacterized membrane protein YcaP (DUF421 family)